MFRGCHGLLVRLSMVKITATSPELPHVGNVKAFSSRVEEDTIDCHTNFVKTWYFLLSASVSSILRYVVPDSFDRLDFTVTLWKPKQSSNWLNVVLIHCLVEHAPSTLFRNHVNQVWLPGSGRCTDYFPYLRPLTTSCARKEIVNFSWFFVNVIHSVSINGKCWLQYTFIINRLKNTHFLKYTVFHQGSLSTSVDKQIL